MDLLIVDPPQLALKGIPTDRAYNVGPASLAAYLRREGMEVAILNGDLLIEARPSNTLQTVIREWKTTAKGLAEGQRMIAAAIDDKGHVIWQKLADVVRKTNPAAVGIPYFTPLMPIVKKVARLVKEINPEIRVIVGAFHPTFCPDEVMQNTDMDFAVVGEGEIALLQLVRELKKGSPRWETVPNIYYRDRHGQVQHNARAPLIADLNGLPFLGRDLVLNCSYEVLRVHTISTARGCPYTCSFCSDRRLWNGKVRRRSVDNVIKEMEYLKDNYKVDFVDFVDGTFTYDRKYLQSFCNTLIERGLDMKWGCTARFDNLDESILRLMKKANCSGMYLGLESGSERMLQAMDKKENVESIIKMSEMIHESGMMSITSVLLGLPYETREDIEATLKLMRRFKTSAFDVNVYIPLPGSPLYDSLDDEDKKNVDWRKVAYKSFDNYFSKVITREDFRKYQVEAYKIADDLRRRSIMRIGAQKMFQSVSRRFQKSDGKADQSPFSYS